MRSEEIAPLDPCWSFQYACSVVVITRSLQFIPPKIAYALREIEQSGFLDAGSFVDDAKSTHLRQSIDKDSLLPSRSKSIILRMQKRRRTVEEEEEKAYQYTDSEGVGDRETATGKEKT